MGDEQRRESATGLQIPDEIEDLHLTDTSRAETASSNTTKLGFVIKARAMAAR
jgi:hypothetical protein